VGRAVVASGCIRPWTTCALLTAEARERTMGGATDYLSAVKRS
jgi:hypothetical protein